jgi:hypothetical protein
MDGEAKAPLEPVLHPSMLLGPVVRSPDLLTHAQAGGIGVPQVAGVLRTSASPVGGWWSTSSPLLDKLDKWIC